MTPTRTPCSPDCHDCPVCEGFETFGVGRGADRALLCAPCIDDLDAIAVDVQAVPTSPNPVPPANVEPVRRTGGTPQGRYWILTIPREEWSIPSELPGTVTYIRGQLEDGANTGFIHWQLVAYFSSKVTLVAVKRVFGTNRLHAELSRSDSVRSYVWKDETSLGERFELGRLPGRRNSSHDWDEIWRLATINDFGSIPSQIRVCHYNKLRRISSDYSTPLPGERRVVVYWGKTGTGKSRNAWADAGMDAYPKCPRSKFWDGYRGQKHVVIDEFRGGIDISHLLRWADRYPCNVEIKGSSVALQATSIWITSNISPREWYPDLDDETLSALLRRLEVTHFSGF